MKGPESVYSGASMTGGLHKIKAEQIVAAVTVMLAIAALVVLNEITAGGSMSLADRAAILIGGTGAAIGATAIPILIGHKVRAGKGESLVNQLMKLHSDSVQKDYDGVYRGRVPSQFMRDVSAPGYEISIQSPRDETRYWQQPDTAWSEDLKDIMASRLLGKLNQIKATEVEIRNAMHVLPQTIVVIDSKQMVLRKHTGVHVTGQDVALRSLDHMFDPDFRTTFQATTISRNKDGDLVAQRRASWKLMRLIDGKVTGYVHTSIVVNLATGEEISRKIGKVTKQPKPFEGPEFDTAKPPSEELENFLRDAARNQYGYLVQDASGHWLRYEGEETQDGRQFLDWFRMTLESTGLTRAQIKSVLTGGNQEMSNEVMKAVYVQTKLLSRPSKTTAACLGRNQTTETMYLVRRTEKGPVVEAHYGRELVDNVEGTGRYVNVKVMKTADGIQPPVVGEAKDHSYPFDI